MTKCETFEAVVGGVGGVGESDKMKTTTQRTVCVRVYNVKARDDLLVFPFFI